MRGLKIKVKTLAGAAFVAAGIMLLCAQAFAQGIPGQPLVPLGSCQLAASQLSSSVGLNLCVRATFTASASSSQLVVTAMANGVIKPGDQVVTGISFTVGTVITSQVSGTPGGVGTYNLSAPTTAVSETVTSGGIPAGANEVLIESDTAAVRFRDDGAAPTASIGYPIAANAAPFLYTGTLPALRFIAQTGSPVLNLLFYKSN